MGRPFCGCASSDGTPSYDFILTIDDRHRYGPWGCEGKSLWPWQALMAMDDSRGCRRLWQRVAQASGSSVNCFRLSACSRRTWLRGNGTPPRLSGDWIFAGAREKQYSATFTTTCALSALYAHTHLILEATSCRGE